MSFAPTAQLVVRANGECQRTDTPDAVPETADPTGALAEFVRAATPFADGSVAPRTVGFLSYELGPFLEPRLSARPSRDQRWPLALFSRYEAVATCVPTGRSNGDRCAVLVEAVRREAGEALLEALSQSECAPPASPGEPGKLLEHPQWEEYARAVARAQEYITAGDIYQVNLARRFRVSSPLPPWEAYLRFRTEQPVPFGSYLDTGTFSILSNSPERFLRVTGDRIRTEPIKGTRRRDPDPLADANLARQLLGDSKERAEHIMIVDLERNDLGRLCEKGSVEVSSLLRLETFTTLHHLVSTIDGRLSPGNDLATILRATFPGGSITGTPKIRATEIITELEAEGRGPYTGAIVWLRDETDFDSSIAIRTAVARRGEFSYHAGGGIVADSDAAHEFAECWLKARVFLRALLGEETARALLEKAHSPSPAGPGLESRTQGPGDDLR